MNQNAGAARQVHALNLPKQSGELQYLLNGYFMSLLHTELVAVFLLVLTAALAVAAKRLHQPYPIVLVIGGLVLSFIPHLPRITLDPQLVFLVILPPLLFSAAFNTS